MSQRKVTPPARSEIRMRRKSRPGASNDARHRMATAERIRHDLLRLLAAAVLPLTFRDLQNAMDHETGSGILAGLAALEGERKVHRDGNGYALAEVSA